MNSEIKVLIKAVTSDAKKKIQEVNKELKDIKKTGKDSGKSIEETMKAVAKSAAIVVGAIAAVVAALVGLGKSSKEFIKEQAKLTTAFQASGGSAAQAKKTYIDLYRFMGDSGAATEAAQQLALITTNTEDLAEWTKTLQGVYATMGSTLPIESLAEAANETIKVGKVTGTMADALNWAGVSEDAFNEKLATTNSLAEREALVRSTLNNIYSNAANIYERNNQALLANAESEARLNAALAEAGRVLLPMMTAINNLSATLLTVLKPAFEVVATVVMIFAQWIMTAISWVSAFFSLFLGKSKEASSTTNDVKKNVADTGKSATVAANGVSGLGGALNKAASAAKELKKQTMGFDELNVVSKQDASAGGGGAAGGGGGGGISMPDLSGLESIELPDMEEFKKGLDETKEKLMAILTLVGLIGAGIVVGYLAQEGLLKMVTLTAMQKAQLLAKVRTIGGYMLIVAGATMAVAGYSDAWVNGIDWGNFALTIGGVALLITGIGLAFGGMVAAGAAVGAGLALVVLGVKDFITNGASLQNILTILIGLLAVFAAAWYLASLPVALIVTAIVAVVAAFVILWNECEGFRNFWIGLWEGIKTLFSEFVDWISPKIEAVGKFFSDLWEGIKTSLAPLVEAIGNAFEEAWELAKVVWDLVAPYFEKAWEAIKAIWDFVKPYFELIWDSIVIVFSVVEEWFSGMFSAAWEAIKFVWNTVVSYFTAIWESIAGVFSVVKNVLTGNWEEAWEGIKGIVNTWEEFFSGVWDGIKNVFSAVKTWFKDTFSAAWEAVKNVFSNWGSFFGGLWDTIKTKFSALGTSIGNAISNSVKSGINGIISLIEKTINKGIGLINGAINLINKLPGVSVGKLSEINLPRLAKGGVVDSATVAMIGEAGREAVMPLENNTEWMDKLADRLAARTAAPTKLILKVGEKELGWATINAINGITEQTGGLQLAL